MRMAEEDREGPAVWLERRQRSRAQAQRRRLLRGWAAVRARGEAKQAIQAELAARRRAAMARDQAALFLWRTQAIGAVFCALHALSDLVRERRALRQTMVQCVSRRRINHLTFTWGVWFCRITVLLEGRHLCHIYDERSSMHLVRHRTLLGWQSLLTPLKVARWSHFGSSALRRLLSRSWGRWHGKLADRLRRQRDSMVIAPQLLSMRARHAAVHTRRTFVKWKRRKRRGYLQRLNLRDNAVSSGYGLQGRFGVRSRTHVQPLPRACAGSPGQYLDWGGARYAERAQHGRRRRINALMNDAPGPQAHKLPQITSPRTLVRAHSPNPRDGAAYRATLVEARTTQYDGSASSAPSIDQLIMAAKEFLTSGALTTTASHQPLPFTSNFAQF